MPGLGGFTIGVNSFFLREELAIFGGTFDAFAVIFQGLPEGVLVIEKK